MQLWNPKYSCDVGKYMLKWAGFWCCMVTLRPRSEFNTLYIPFHSNDICLGTMGAPRSSTTIFTSFLRNDSCFILEGTRRKRAQKLCIVRFFFSNYGFKGLFCTVLNPMFWIQSKIYRKHCLLENRQRPKIQSIYNEMICHGIQQCSLFSSSFLNLKR